MTDLPSRLSVRHRFDSETRLSNSEVRELTATILQAYVLGELMTAAEWRRNQAVSEAIRLVAT